MAFKYSSFILIIGMLFACAATSFAEVTLEIKAVQIVLNDEHRQGVDWEAIVSDFHTVQLKREEDPTWLDRRYKASVGTISGEDYAVLLDALDTVGAMTPIPQTSAVLAEGVQQTLTIALADNRAPGPIRIDVLFSKSKDNTQLHIEPFIGEILKDGGRPLAVTLRGKTDVPLEDNTTIVLGGIISEHEITKTHKLPLLGSLPLVGSVFRSQGKLVQKTETMVFLTPRFKAVPSEEDKEKDKEKPQQ